MTYHIIDFLFSFTVTPVRYSWVEGREKKKTIMIIIKLLFQRAPGYSVFTSTLSAVMAGRLRATVQKTQAVNVRPVWT